MSEGEGGGWEEGRKEEEGGSSGLRGLDDRLLDDKKLQERCEEQDNKTREWLVSLKKLYPKRNEKNELKRKLERQSVEARRALSPLTADFEPYMSTRSVGLHHTSSAY